MAKRPPNRSTHRNASQDDSVLRANMLRAATSTAEGDSPADAGGAAAEAGAGAEPRFAANRGELLDQLAELRGQGALSVADEAAILREYDGLLVQLKAEKARLEAEYRERLERDGRDETDQWLAGAAEALGRRQGEQMRRLMKTIPALAPEQAAG